MVRSGFPTSRVETNPSSAIWISVISRIRSSWVSALARALDGAATALNASSWELSVEAVTVVHSCLTVPYRPIATRVACLTPFGSITRLR
jgi:hypothetical protein